MPSPGCHTGDLGGQLGVTPLPSPSPLMPGEAVMGTQGPRFSQGNPPPWGSHGTFLNELSPPLGPVGELLGVGLLDLGPLVHAVHEVIAEPVSVVDPLHRALVVPHLGWARGQAAVGAVNILPASAQLPWGGYTRQFGGAGMGALGWGCSSPTPSNPSVTQGEPRLRPLAEPAQTQRHHSRDALRQRKEGSPQARGCPGVQ